MDTSRLVNTDVVPLIGKADCGAIVEFGVLLLELIPEILVLSALPALPTAAVLEDSVVWCCCDSLLVLRCCCSS